MQFCTNQINAAIVLMLTEASLFFFFFPPEEASLSTAAEKLFCFAKLNTHIPQVTVLVYAFLFTSDVDL